ncbi:hypothetical protein HK099_007599 [Clydaea vesicula]|uniref:C3H1-type domain-containing protein n=1 Tax=Clydaea vesicula TaxID=447962 RepID=A0AAD5U5C5_9FUNG|nr:hypothetical protein HK099_007599 [Clydaea vesicula]
MPTPTQPCKYFPFGACTNVRCVYIHEPTLYPQPEDISGLSLLMKLHQQSLKQPGGPDLNLVPQYKGVTYQEFEIGFRNKMTCKQIVEWKIAHTKQ